MAFYPFSIFSVYPLGIAYAILAVLFGVIWWLSRNAKHRWPIRAFAVIVLTVLPVSEELWIAWNFARACNEAGTFINKKVTVEGFYDDTSGWGPRQLAEANYTFMESKDIAKGELLRVEPADNAARDKALAWYEGRIRNKQPHEGPYIVQRVSEKERTVVAPNRVDAWVVRTIDHPTARYHFKNSDPMNGTAWAHKIVRSGSVIVDTATGEEVARYSRFGRGAPWFFVSLDRPGFACDAPGQWPYARSSVLIYRSVLIPSTEKR